MSWQKKKASITNATIFHRNVMLKMLQWHDSGDHLYFLFQILLLLRVGAEN